ncbi:hypothetical protein [Priestia taiwanensis]|uniref:Uncharacterized protein n=1 Tax=Priestia taiwanensis TaxID=1347902 RepID=A0A917AV94_9BACI|nr:hypothetical protein [Priestia taiwanensis]MBM7364686.1 hypothetical protein [Priestia taiwanensis]GGE78884.1 hypothetical protein GCM10007140_30510 [Priestia taiwanensis]
MTKNNNGMKAFLLGIGVGLAASMLNKNNRVAVKKQSRKAKHKVLELKGNTAELTLKVKEQVSHVQKSIGEMSKDISVVKRKLDDIKPHVIRSLSPRKARQRKEEMISLPVGESTVEQIEEVVEVPLVEEVQAISSEEVQPGNEEAISELEKEEATQPNEKVAK